MRTLRAGDRRGRIRDVASRNRRRCGGGGGTPQGRGGGGVSESPKRRGGMVRFGLRRAPNWSGRVKLGRAAREGTDANRTNWFGGGDCGCRARRNHWGRGVPGS